MKRKLVAALILLVILAIWESQNREQRRFKKFEACMEKNNFEYSDALCEYCWEQTK